LNQFNFKILNTRTVYKSTKTQVDKLTIQTPKGDIVEWDCNYLPNMFQAIPVVSNGVMMTKEWRVGPQKVTTQFVSSRCVSDDEKDNIIELRRELKEELGIIGGNFVEVFSFHQGVHTAGKTSIFIVENFEIQETDRDKHEIQEIVHLPIKNLFNELAQNHTVVANTLLGAKIIEDYYEQGQLKNKN
jgi:hypothetical protein